MTAPEENLLTLTKKGDITASQPPTFNIELATIKGIDTEGCPLVQLQRNEKQRIKALSQIKVSSKDIGKTCTIAFIGGDKEKPIIMGLLYTAESDDEPLIIESRDSIILKTGDSKIELHANGRVHLQGMHISSQAYGPNQLKGASVKIN